MRRSDQDDEVKAQQAPPQKDEAEELEVAPPSPEEQAAQSLQDQLGNQGVAELMGLRRRPGRPRAHLGGTADPGDDPLSIADGPDALSRLAADGAGDNREPEPDEGLPPSAPSPAPLVLPDVLPGRAWVDTFTQIWPCTWAHIALAHALRPPCWILQDPRGQAWHGRLRAAALSSAWPLGDAGPVVSRMAAVADVQQRLSAWVTIVDRSSGSCQTRVAETLSAAGVSLDRPPPPPSPAPQAAVRDAIAALVGLPSLEARIPNTGIGADLEEQGLMERVASRTHTTVGSLPARFAAVALALRDGAGSLLPALPASTLLGAAAAIDACVAEALPLLTEVATAARQGSVPPWGLRNGLRKVAHLVHTAVHDACDELAGPLATGLPDHGPPAAVVRATDAVGQAFADGEPEAAATWLRSQPPSLDRDLAQLFTAAARGRPPSELAPEAARLRAEADVPWHPALRTVEAMAWLWQEQPTRALGPAEAELGEAEAAGHGPRIGAAALTLAETYTRLGTPDAAQEARQRGGGWLDRWSPAPDPAG